MNVSSNDANMGDIHLKAPPTMPAKTGSRFPTEYTLGLTLASREDASSQFNMILVPTAKEATKRKLFNIISARSTESKLYHTLAVREAAKRELYDMVPTAQFKLCHTLTAKEKVKRQFVTMSTKFSSAFLLSSNHL